MKKTDVAVVMPVYNEAPVVAGTIRSLEKENVLIVCVNDGSSDTSASEIAKTDAILVNHPVNLGQGAALQTGIDYALQFPGIKYFATFDADGQHDLEDMKRMVDLVRKGEDDIVLGSRFLGEAHNITIAKKLMLRAAVLFTNILSGVRLTDTHNGLRAFNRTFAEQLSIAMPGMAHASEIIDKIGQGKWRYREIPVTIHYSDYSKAKGQSMLNSINILIELLLSRSKK